MKILLIVKSHNNNSLADLFENGVRSREKSVRTSDARLHIAAQSESLFNGETGSPQRSEAPAAPSDSTISTAVRRSAGEQNDDTRHQNTARRLGYPGSCLVRGMLDNAELLPEPTLQGLHESREDSP